MLVLLGLAVLALRRTAPALAFAAFALGAGGFYVTHSFIGGVGLPGAAALPPALLWLTMLVWSAVTWALVLRFPRKLERADLPHALAGILFGIAAGLSTFVLRGQQAFAYPGASSTDVWLLRMALFTLNVAWALAILLPPLRVRHLPATGAPLARTYGLLGVGFALFTAGTLTRALFAPGESVVYAAMNGLFAFLPLVLWARATQGAHHALARNVALAYVAIFVGALLIDPAASSYAYPVGRVLGALLLAYAVLRGQIEGLDVKVRFALSKSTIAAVFIAVFFIASEVAQQFFGQTFSSAYVGIAAAGMLVFALAPLQRAAERLAERAVPIGASSGAPAPAHATPSSATAPPEREQAFRRAVRLALRDRQLTREEERHLLDLAHHLGIAPLRAGSIQDEVQRETGGRV